MVSELADLRRTPPWEAGAVRAPVLSLCGEHARPHHRDAMQHLTGMLADCRSETVVGAGHAGPHTHADAVAASVVEFLRSSSPGQRPVGSDG